MDFGTATQVDSLIETMKQAETTRAPNRALINDLYNGVPPYTKQEEDENHILVNINWREGTTLLHQCRRQYENAFLKPGNYFRVNLEAGPIEKRRDWSRIITRHINKPLKRSLAFMEAYRSKFAGVVLHGVGPMVWEDKYKWIPYTFGIEDLLIPTDTYTTLENLTYFAVRKPMKPGELYRKTVYRELYNKDALDPGWDIKAVKEILSEMKDVNQNAYQWNWSDHPEKMAEVYKQNQTYYDGDSAPIIWFWDFYYQEEEGENAGRWNRRLMLDRDSAPGNLSGMTSPIRFIYKRDGFAENLNQIMHLQFGDGNNKPPFMYHSVRSIGWLLFDVVHMSNRLRCQFTEHVFEQMMALFQVGDPADRDRIQRLLLMNKGIMPEGTRMLASNERYTVDGSLVEALQANYRQLMSEATAAYTQDIDEGTQKERTATEVMAQVNSINQLTASLINYAYLRETHAYTEICRRFCLEDSPEAAVKNFRKKCLSEGIEEQYLDVDYWDVQPERVLGGGNKVLEVAQAQQLLQLSPRLDPDSQREVYRTFISAVTDDEDFAHELVKDKPEVTDARHDADLAFGALMQGVPIPIKMGLNHRDQVEELLRLMTGVVQRIAQSGGVGTPQDVVGLQNVGNYITQHLKIMAQDKMEKQEVRKYMQLLHRLLNEVKAFAQRQQQMAEKQAQEQQQGGLEMMKARAKIAMDQQKLGFDQQRHQMEMQHDDQRFALEESRKQREAENEIHRKNALAGQDMMHKQLSAANDRSIRAFDES